MSDNVNEFVIEWVRGDDKAYITTPTNCALKTRLLRLAEEYPSEVEIVKINHDGSTYCCVPTKYISIRHPKKTRKMTEEEKQAAAERLAKARERKNGSDN